MPLGTEREIKMHLMKFLITLHHSFGYIMHTQESNEIDKLRV